MDTIEFQYDQTKFQKLILKTKVLFWDCKVDHLSPQAAVERFLNYAELDQIKDLIDILGYDNVRNIFKKQISQERFNYISPQTVNFFILKFQLKDEIPYEDIINKAERNIKFTKKI